MIQLLDRVSSIESCVKNKPSIEFECRKKNYKIIREQKDLVMDLAVAWYQDEQEGEAKRIWSNIWETAEMVS